MVEIEDKQELINLLYNNHLSQYGKRKLESYIKKQQQQIQDLENTIDRILDEQAEREKYTYELEEKLKEHHILTNTAKETNRQIIFKED